MQGVLWYILYALVYKVFTLFLVVMPELLAEQIAGSACSSIKQVHCKQGADHALVGVQQNKQKHDGSCCTQRDSLKVIMGTEGKHQLRRLS